MFSEALAGGNLEQVMICIDFVKVMSQSALTGRGFTEGSFSVNEDGKHVEKNWSYFPREYLFSKRIAVLALETIFPREISVDEQAEFRARHKYLNDGTRAGDSHLFTNDYRKGMRPIFEHSLDNISRILKGRQFSAEQLNYYQEILEICYQQGIQYEIILSPCHGAAVLAYDEMGKSSDFFTFKREVVELEHEMALKYRHTPKGICDFTVVSGLNISEFLNLEVPEKKGYSDPLHYTKEVGGEVLRIISSEIGDEFGVRVNLGEMDGHLKSNMRDIHSYRELQPDVSDWVEQVVLESQNAMGTDS
jgi:hypothetical protein